jgi:hypothetical protein
MTDKKTDPNKAPKQPVDRKPAPDKSPFREPPMHRFKGSDDFGQGDRVIGKRQ